MRLILITWADWAMRWARCFATTSPAAARAFCLQGTIHNRVAQGDYGIEQLQLRQGDLVERRNQNQLVVDISNYMVALRQARSRYSQAVDSRKLQQELLEKSQQSFSFGAATISDVEAAQTCAGGGAGNRSRHAVGL